VELQLHKKHQTSTDNDQVLERGKKT